MNRSGATKKNKFVDAKSANLLCCCALLFSLMISGCQATRDLAIRNAAHLTTIGNDDVIRLKKLDRVNRLGPIRRLVGRRTLPSSRTQLFLRNNNLHERYTEDPTSTVQLLEQNSRSQPSMDSTHAVAELAQLEGDWYLRTNRVTDASRHYAAAVVHAYQFLFDDSLDVQRNAFDPQFREICDIYNHSLENLLRIFCSETAIESGVSHLVGNGNEAIAIDVVVEGRWREEEFDRFELVNDFQVSGIDNHYRTFGLGVPLIAVRKPTAENNSTFEKYYPPSLSIPLTAFLEVQSYDHSEGRLHSVLRLFDPQQQTSVKTKAGVAPLESDLTVPIAYYLQNPILNTDLISTATLFDANIASNYFGFYMLEPYDPEKIPVVLVHGLWSSPVTWMKMYNDLNSDISIRKNYQFWFYMYPTGQPFWFSAAEMRNDLKQLRQDVDPENQSTAMQEMILVGHSMGGLVSRMQTISSGESFWGLLSDFPLEEMRGSAETKQKIRELVYFEPDDNIEKVVTIATPHRGSKYANNVTRWLSHKVFTLPTNWTESLEEFLKVNHDRLKTDKKIMIPTSVDSLAADSPFIYALGNTKANPGVEYHNVIGNEALSRFVETISHQELGDGVVSIQSAQFPEAISSIVVASEHSKVHRHPQTIFEVKRILLENLDGTKRESADHAVRMADHQASIENAVPDEKN